MAYFCDELSPDDAAVVKQYINAGAIALVKGNTS
jgi:hypothetical protein